MGRWRPVGLAAAFGLPLVGFACNAISGADALSFSDCDGCAGAELDADVRDSNGDVLGSDAATMPDGSADAGLDARPDGAVARPSYCSGIVMYARFDGTLTTAEGIAPETPPAASFVPGHFGMATVLSGVSSAVYYVAGDGGVQYAQSEGTMAMWVMPQWPFPQTATHIFWKPVTDRSTNGANASGPFLVAESPANGTIVGAKNNEPVTGASITASATATELAPYWSASWNHVVQTWSKSAPTLSFTLNGGGGDATVTRRETKAGWQPQNANGAYVRLSSNSYPSDAAYDDVVMWNRSLSLAEIQAVYASGIAVGDACGL